MWMAIFGFEIRYQLRQPFVHLVTLILSVLLFLAGSGSSPGQSGGGALHLNAPAVILEQLLKYGWLVLFLLTGVVTSTAVRDFEHHTEGQFFSKPVSRVALLTARFAGALSVCALPFIVGTIALAAGTFMPEVEPTRRGPFSVTPYAFALGVLMLPTLIALGGVIFALATWTRQALFTFVAAAALFAVSATAGLINWSVETAWIGELLDPFGVTALSGALRYWTTAELNASTPALTGTLLWNRLLWLGIGLTTMSLVVRTFDPTRQRRWWTGRADMGGTDGTDVISASAAASIPLVRHTTSASATTWLKCVRRCRLEVRTAIWNLPFLGFVVVGLALLLQEADAAGNLFGMAMQPRTALMLEALGGSYAIVLLLAVLLLSGELLWKERALDLHELHDALPTTNAIYLGAKIGALLVVITTFLIIGVLALIGLQTFRGYSPLEAGVYLRGAVATAVYPALLMMLACGFHVLAPHKLLGHGWVLLFIVVWDVLEEFGFEHHLYRFGSLPPLPYSDFNGYGPFLTPFLWYSVYWACAGVLILSCAALFWKRGTDTAWRTRWNAARHAFQAPMRSVVAGGLLAFAGTGMWIYWNTNVRNSYRPELTAAERRAAYERRYRQHEGLALPRITVVRSNVDVHPESRRVGMRGTYHLRNTSSHALSDVHISVPERVRLSRLDLPVHDVVLRDDTLGYHILRLQHPLAPGDSTELSFDVSIDHDGFVNNGTDVTVVENGSYFTNRDLFPVIGYDPHRQLSDNAQRGRFGLGPLRMASPEDSTARRSSPRSPDADRVRFETIVSTSPDQVVVTSGALDSQWMENGRRYFRYISDIPITHHVAFASARYAVTRRDWNGVTIEAYHLPDHSANVARMVDAAVKTLTYATAHFGPYQHRYLRLVEVPGHARDGTAFPGMIALSEAMGFTARRDDGVEVDYAFHVTAHEVAHQWWGQQLVGANAQGTGTLHESLAQYTALMTAEHEFGRDRMRPVLAHEHEWYLRGRSGERGAEPALAYAERQEYVYYHKGALAMYALRDHMGEESLNGVLSAYLARVANQGPPYTTAVELIDALRSTLSGHAESESQRLLSDLFERNVRFNASLASATGTPRAEGEYLVRVELRARKLQTDSTGAENEVPVDDWIDVSVRGTVGGRAVILFEGARRIRGAAATHEIVVKGRPTQVEIDPYHKLVDKETRDNVRAVEVGRRAGH